MDKLSKIFVSIGAFLYLIFGMFHLSFFRFLNHKNPYFNQIVPFLSKIMIMLNLGMFVFFISMGLIMLRYRSQIISSKLGKGLLIMSSLFFFIRGIAEFAFPTFKIAFVITMFVLALVYFVPVFNNRNKI
jgi:hypothetical protein